MLTGNSYNPKTGMIEGDHLRHLAKTGIHKLVERVNGALYGCKPLSVVDLPSKVRDLVAQSEKLAEQLLRCESVPVQLAPDYICAQATLAAEALPMVQAELQRREDAVRAALEHLRKTLVNKGDNLVEVAVLALLSLDRGAIANAVEVEAGLNAWRTCFAIVRDNSTGKTVPRWLTIALAQHEAARASAAAIG